MGRPLPDIAVELGRRLREARQRQGLTQAAVAAAVGVSAPTISRMELGRGRAVGLGVWVDIGLALGESLFWATPTRPDVYADAVVRLAQRGGWRLTAAAPDALWFDRPMRRDPRLSLVLLPAERVVVRVVRTLTDLDHEAACLRDVVATAEAAAADGLAVGGLLVVVRSSANLRRAGRAGRLSSQLWISALRSRLTRIPPWPGRVWLAQRGSHWLSVG